MAAQLIVGIESLIVLLLLWMLLLGQPLAAANTQTLLKAEYAENARLRATVTATWPTQTARTNRP